MAEIERNKVLEDSKTELPSNEEVIDSLVKDMGDSFVRDSVAQDEPSVIHKVSQLNIDGDSKDNESNENETTQEPDCDQEESDNVDKDDFIDEEHLKDLEVDYTDEDRMRLKGEAEELKNEGNNHFKGGEFKEAALTYTKALRICPLAFSKNRSVLYSNRAAAKIKLFLNESAIEDCTKAVELDPQYIKAYVRRAQLYEETDKLDEALADYKKILEVDPLHRDALFASKRLAEQINERNEKLKTEMLGKLKDLGNMFLKPFGLSTNNFQMVQDPNTGGYSINFSQNPNHS